MAREKKRETNGITISFFFAWQFMVDSMICMSGQPGFTQAGYHGFLSEKFCLRAEEVSKGASLRREVFTSTRAISRS